MDTHITYIKPQSTWRLVDFKELKEYRDLFFFLVWRNVKVLYAQTVLGFFWAILQPLVQIVVFSIVFGKVARISTDGIPYVLFSSVAIIPWTYLQEAMSQSSQSLVQGQGMLGKIYFPRLIFPLAPILSGLVGFAISIVIIIGLLIYYHIVPTWQLLLFPVCMVFMMMTAAGVGLWLSAVAIRFRDVKFAMPFIMKMLIYSAPIVYSATSIPSAYRFVYSLNPIVGVIEGFRAALLGTSIPWEFVWPGFVVAIVLFVSGTLYFKKMEQFFVDVI